MLLWTCPMNIYCVLLQKSDEACLQLCVKENQLNFKHKGIWWLNERFLLKLELLYTRDGNSSALRKSLQTAQALEKQWLFKSTNENRDPRTLNVGIIFFQPFLARRQLVVHRRLLVERLLLYIISYRLFGLDRFGRGWLLIVFCVITSLSFAILDTSLDRVFTLNFLILESSRHCWQRCLESNALPF